MTRHFAKPLAAAALCLAAVPALAQEAEGQAQGERFGTWTYQCDPTGATCGLIQTQRRQADNQMILSVSFR